MKRRDFMMGTAAAAAAIPLGLRAEATTPLSYPPLLDATQSGAFSLTAQAGKTSFKGYRTASSTWGFNQAFLGPTVRVGQRPTAVSVTNTLPEAVSVHWHGLIIPGEVDGGPHQPIAPNATWTPELDVTQPAATLWYHSHIHGETARQVYNGLAGVLQVSDGQDDARGLPSAYGVDDLTLVLQDRKFNWFGHMSYDPAMPDRMMGFAGDNMLVNGQIGATAVVPQGIVRLRLLNGSNGRIYSLTMKSGRLMHLVATDSGLLPEPVALSGFTLAPGERVEVLINFGNGNGDTLMSGPNLNSGMMGGMMGGTRETVSFEVLPFEVDSRLTARITQLPTDIGGEVPDLDPTGAERRDFSLDMGMGPGMLLGGGFAINGVSFDMNRVDLSVKRGVLQRWHVSARMLMHPFHVHGVRFQVLSENGRPPRAQNRGWKDTVLVNGNAEILMRFEKPAPAENPFMFHCHILEHEDGGMMGQFAVT